jgi:hypothetical protein
MALSHSTIRSIVFGVLGALLEALVMLPGSFVGSYLEATFGVSTVFLIQAILSGIGFVLLGYFGYTIVRAVVGWRRTFHGEIVAKNRFLLGEEVHFKAWFKGELKHGLFTCHVRLADGSFEYWPAYDTFRRSENGDLGVLSGRKVHEAEWSGPILKAHPTGNYEAHIKVCDRADLGSDNLTVKEKLVSFWVLPPGYVSSSGGISATITSSGDTGFMIQAAEAERDARADLLTLVYVPLYSAVLEMKEGKDTFPHTNLTVGNPHNPWSANPKIIQQVVDVFDKYSALIENDDVRKGWDTNKDHLRNGKFWYGKDQQKWLESIEKEYQNARTTGSRQAVMPQPELFIPLTMLGSTGEVKELEVRFPNGESRKNRVCFYYVTVRAKGEKTVENVYASLDGNELRIVPRTAKASFGIDYNRFSVEDFDKVGPREFVYALLREQKKTKDRIEYLHPRTGQDFVLFFGVEGLTDLYIAANTYVWYNPRTGFCGHHRDDGAGILKLKLDLSGQDAKGCSMIFEVAFRKWDSFIVTPIELPQ